MRGTLEASLVYGSFDPLHHSHLELFRAARDYGDRLIVGLSTDEFGKKKGKEHRYSYEERTMALYFSGLVDLVIPEHDWNQKESDIKKYNVSHLCMGEDWKGKFNDLPCEVKYFARGEIDSSSIKEKQEDLLKLLVKIREAFKKERIKYWIDYGTLLGAVRDGDIIPHDEDADIGVMEYDIAKIKNLSIPGVHLEYRPKGEFYRFYSMKQNYVDIFVWRQEGYMLTRPRFFGAYDKNKGKEILAADIQNLTTLTIRGEEFSAPRNPKQFLDHRYRLGWVRPKIYVDPTGEKL